MANPFALGPNDDPTAGLPDEGTFNKLRDQWTTFMEQPGGRAALLSAGLSLMQPPSFGDTPTSQIGRALGVAGETVGHQEAMNLKQREADIKQQDASSKELLRSSQADAATSRADTAAARLGTQASNLQLQQERLAAGERQKTLQQRIKLSADYGRYRGAIEARNLAKDKAYENNRLTNPQLQPPQHETIMSPEDYFAQAERALGGTAVPSGAPPLQDPNQSGYPVAKANDPNRAPGPYQTPKGVMNWNGTAWEPL